MYGAPVVATSDSGIAVAGQVVEVGYAARRGGLPCAVARGVAEGAGGGLGVGIGWDGGGVFVRAWQQPDRLNLVNYRRGDRHRRPRRLHLRNQVAGCGRGFQCQDSVDAGVGAGQFQAPAEEAGRDRRRGIDGSGHRGTGGEHVPERPPDVLGKVGDLPAHVAARVGGEHPAAAGIGRWLLVPAAIDERQAGTDLVAADAASINALLLDKGFTGRRFAGEMASGGIDKAFTAAIVSGP